MVNCFTQKYEQWLPAPNYGDVVILRELKVSIAYSVSFFAHQRLIQAFSKLFNARPQTMEAAVPQSGTMID
jgi:hypothetical protein